MELFYVNPSAVDSDRLTLDEFETRHIRNTLRKKEGDKIHVGDGAGNRFLAQIRSLTPRLVCRIIERDHKRPETPFALAIGFIRPNRLEWILEKATEMGVNEFILVKTAHSSYYSSNSKRFEKITRQAMKQSLGYFKPKVILCPSWKDFQTVSQRYDQKFAALDPGSPPLRNKEIQQGKAFMFCVGPEGGFSENETALLIRDGFEDVSLGDRRLRSETAALSGLAWLMLKR